MVRPKARRRDDDLCPVTDRNGRVHGRTVTASSHCVTGLHSTSDTPCTPAPLKPRIYYNPGASESFTQPPHIPIRTHPPLPSDHPYTSIPYEIYGSSQLPSQAPSTSYDSYAHSSSMPPHISSQDHVLYRTKHQTPLNEISGIRVTKVGLKSMTWLDLSTSTGRMFRLSLRMMIMMAIVTIMRTSLYLWPLHHHPVLGQVQEKRLRRGIKRTMKDGSRQDQLREIHRVQSLSLHTAYILLVLHGMDRSELFRVVQSDLSITCSGGGINTQELAQVAEDPDKGLFPEVWIYMYFLMFVIAVRAGAKSCKLYIQGYPMLGHKSKHKLLDIHLRLDVMSADEVRWTPYKPSEILDQCILAHPIRPLEAYRLANNRMYILEAPSHLLTETWTSVLIVFPSRCIDDYMHGLSLGPIPRYKILTDFHVAYSTRLELYYHPQLSST
ncbi:hypothetical protein M9H77_26097 [Catharanthus roseus]|uniref:Uncharacterized protein n=1 Tax=Catharanthus roseus TaxID=4058 RepID=A0ACC0A9K4_CATRO|nr:hypothetical protein M9H77_26097 [Catharanthus roseus]